MYHPRRRWDESIAKATVDVARGMNAETILEVFIFSEIATHAAFWGLSKADSAKAEVRELGTATGGIASFGVDDTGEILWVTYGGPIFPLDFSQSSFEV